MIIIIVIKAFILYEKGRVKALLKRHIPPLQTTNIKNKIHLNKPMHIDMNKNKNFLLKNLFYF